MLSKKFHILEEKLLESDVVIPASGNFCALNKNQIKEIFKDDASCKDL